MDSPAINSYTTSSAAVVEAVGLLPPSEGPSDSITTSFPQLVGGSGSNERAVLPNVVEPFAVTGRAGDYVSQG